MVSTAALQTVRAADGYELTHRVWDGGNHRATIVMFSGVMSHSAWFEPLAGDLVRAGFRLIGADRRGSGVNDVNRGDAPDSATVVNDALAIVEHYRNDRPWFLLGWCWGAILALNVIRRIDDTPAGLVLATPGLYPSAAVVANAKAHRTAAGEGPLDEAVVAMPIDETMFTEGPPLDDFVRRDDRRLTHMTRRFDGLMGKLAVGAAATVRRINLPTLVLLASRDEATDNDEARKAWADRATIEVIEGAHGIQLDAPGEMASAVRRFVEAQLVS